MSCQHESDNGSTCDGCYYASFGEDGPSCDCEVCGGSIGPRDEVFELQDQDQLGGDIFLALVCLDCARRWVGVVGELETADTLWFRQTYPALSEVA